ncbi:MAG: alanine--tRNA ligase [Phycisphaerae bacterium]
MSKTSNEIRREFIDFFKQRGHEFVPSSSILPADDPTLLFANAGMNQFKDIFLGRETREYTRAANTQKCVRAGGKHNDLEDVGTDTYHHTFFEMLGNWSFGDYFKKEAIDWAWELLTGVWGLEPQRLHATYFEGDQSDDLAPDNEARDLWRQYLPDERIHTGNKKDNFWEMGDTGPCGPCSEIHYDATDDLSGGSLVNKDDPKVIEIWNLVFMQFNRAADGKLSPLPAQHVDTGMGFERITRILQDRQSNYGTDLFIPLLKAIEDISGCEYGKGSDDRYDSADMTNQVDIACRVIADHARTLTFGISDGIIPSNEGRGYVLRRILRRACRYGRQYLNIDGAFLYRLVDVVIDVMGGFFTDLKGRRDYVVETIREEEEAFNKTLDRGIELFQRQADELKQQGEDVLPGEVAFDLYTTYGFPVDLTQLMAEEVGLKVDVEGYDHAMARHRELSSGGEQFTAAAITGLPATDAECKYNPQPIEATVLGWVVGDKFIQDGVLNKGDEAGIVLDRTNFYGEQGGQVGDAGVLLFDGGRFAVRDTQLAGQCVLHMGVLESGELHSGQKVTTEIDPARFDTMRNHTSTHLLNWALRKVLGDHVNQAGSVVDPEKLRFDFTHNKALTAEQQAEIEKLVNQRVLEDLPVGVNIIPLAEAQEIEGVRAVFGEKYPDPVRVISIGTENPQVDASQDTPVEFCGGTHLQRTSQAGLFKIIAEESVAKGVRRITAVTGRSAVEQVQEMDRVLQSTSAVLRVPGSDIPERVEAMQKEIKKLRKRPAAPAAGANEMQPVAEMETEQGKVIVARFPAADANAMRNLCDRQRQKGTAAMFVGATDGQKVMLIAMVNDEMVKQASLKAGDWVKQVAPVVGGGGGGKPTMAQAGGKQPEKLDEALQAAADFVRDKLA